MKKKKLALLLAVAMSVTSIDSTAMMVNAADFTSEDVQEQGVLRTNHPKLQWKQTLKPKTVGCFQRIHPKMKA